MLSSCIGGGYINRPHVKVCQTTPLTAEAVDYNKLTNKSLIGAHELDVLKTLPNSLLVERERKCQNCIRAHAASIVKCLVVRGSCDVCDKKKMLLYGYCPDFESADVLELEAAANGVE